MHLETIDIEIETIDIETIVLDLHIVQKNSITLGIIKYVNRN